LPALRFEYGRCSTANLGRPDATAAVFTDDGWYRTGDGAAIDAGGMHRIVGRESTDLIKIGGYRVGAGEVETALLGHEGVFGGRRRRIAR
jgi:fatty acid CoA ligase FadD36